MKNFYQFSLSTTNSQQFIDITHLLREAIHKSNIKDGIAICYCPHTTAGITINEKADPDVVKDILNTFNKAFPERGDYKHFEGNSHAHIKSSLVGCEKTIIINNGELVLGTWQSIYFCEFDGPRQRKVYVKIIQG
ncbi:secondary thiamine-phosphate synthase enzyme [Alkalithermobacter thermoalcaliphilus JW-YL-7 = DSM 7308]|uniref:Secondary thiamine-phosphate synthase enzyme n=1 Tax=Alkalithermobacter thermoalcaliphilus JW-YL-7 = DSM 7308 TaxID=1121328 RepID=A0A150FR43_CLOPD|nr:protein of unknown function UPF0047 [[Clostridium] paradoxum JW-YL-7 = DSM 7308]SHL00920.1 secondary thiamine-phosphate synthase enzyme [[Clostridium] paradoxum JW-YL-7 = DSM 7308]